MKPDIIREASVHLFHLQPRSRTGRDYFVGFNRAIGVNADHDEADDEVTIVQVDGGNGESYSQSFLKATLAEEEEYTIRNFANSGGNIIVRLVEID